MVKNSRPAPRRTEALTRDGIVDAAIELLDENGEAGLTFSALSARLATGPGAIYRHIAHKGDLLTAACDTLVARSLDAAPDGATPAATIRAVGGALYDTIDAHHWVGSALTRAAGQLPMVRILERIGQQVQALGVPKRRQWTVVSALLNYVLGVAGQNAANAEQAGGIDRNEFLDAVAATWRQLDPEAYPFTAGIAGQLTGHDDRADFLAGIDLILAGLG